MHVARAPMVITKLPPSSQAHWNPTRDGAAIGCVVLLKAELQGHKLADEW